MHMVRRLHYSGLTAMGTLRKVESSKDNSEEEPDRERHNVGDRAHCDCATLLDIHKHATNIL